MTYQKSSPTGLKKLRLIFLVAILLAIPSSLALAAAPKIVAIDGMALHADLTIKDNLATLVGKRVSCQLQSGKTIVGTVKAVSEHLALIEKLEGKSFFDALIKIADISAVEVRSREYEKRKK